MLPRMKRVACFSEKSCTSVSLKQYLPELGWSRSPRIFNRVDFPHPEGPITATNSPFSIWMFTLFRAKVSISLLRNALESYPASGEGAEPELRFRLAPGQPDIKLDICNNGEPIPAELREQIFIPFFTTRESGAGIGLSLSKQIMLKLGGDITLSSYDSEFTCFTLSLPA